MVYLWVESEDEEVNDIRNTRLRCNQNSSLMDLSCNVLNCHELSIKAERTNKDSLCWLQSNNVSNNFAPRVSEDIMSPVKSHSTNNAKHKTDFENVSDFQVRLQADSIPETDRTKTQQLLSTSLRKLKANHEKLKPITQHTTDTIPKFKKFKSFSRETENLIELKFGLPLPSRFTQLCKLSSVLDQIINYFKMKNKLLAYESLKVSIEANSKVYQFLI